MSISLFYHFSVNICPSSADICGKKNRTFSDSISALYCIYTLYLISQNYSIVFLLFPYFFTKNLLFLLLPNVFLSKNNLNRNMMLHTLSGCLYISSCLFKYRPTIFEKFRISRMYAKSLPKIFFSVERSFLLLQILPAH